MKLEYTDQVSPLPQEENMSTEDRCGSSTNEELTRDPLQTILQFEY